MIQTAFAGAKFYMQWVITDDAFANPLGLVLSDGLEVTIGI